MKRKPDIMSIVGVLLAFGLTIFGIILNVQKDIIDEEKPNVTKDTYMIDPTRLFNFFDASSLLIVVGGTFSVLMLSFPLSQFGKIPKHLRIIFMPNTYNPQAYIEKLVECAKKARISGLLALEEDIAELDDAFMKSALLMVVDSVDPEKVKQQLESWLDNLEERHAQERALYDKGAGYAPAFGMIGTLIGLINMMKNLEDTASVGPNMAVALVTTFYGSLLANIIFAPISNKLKVRHDEEYLCKLIICEGVEAIQAGENPKFIQERLVNVLPEYQKKKLGLDDGEGEGEGGGGKKGKKPKKEKKK